MRPIFPGLLGAFALGVWVADYDGFPVVAALQLGIFLTLTAVAILRRRVERVGLACGIAFAAGVVCLGLRLDAASHQDWAPLEATLQARVCGSAHGFSRFTVELCQVVFLDRPNPASFTRVNLVASRDGPAGEWVGALGVGALIRFRANVEPLHERLNPGGRGFRRFHERRGVGATARLLDPLLAVRVQQVAGWNPSKLRRWVESLRQKVADRLQSEGEGGGLLAALAVGNRAGLGPEARAAFRRLGVSHLLAISGLHLALVTAFAYMLIWFLLCRVGRGAVSRDARRPAILLALGVACSYAIAAGWGIPVRRALVFVVAVAFAFVVRRPSAGLNVWAAAALAILAAEPGALFDLGAQLSFAASAGLIVGLHPLAGRDWIAQWRVGCFGLWSHALELLGVSAVAMIATAPVIAWHGLANSPYGLIANLMLVPLTAFFLLPLAWGAAIVALFSAHWAANRFLELAAAASSEVVAGITRVAEGLPAAPLAGSPANWVWWIALLLTVISLRVRSFGLRICGAAFVVVLLSWGPRHSILEDPQVIVFDVGQGDSVLVRGDAGAVLVDGGWGRDAWTGLGRSVVVPGLRTLGIRRLDVAVVTHADADHRGGLEAVVREVEVAELWLPPGGKMDPDLAGLVAAALRRGTAIREVSEVTGAVAVGDIRVTPLWPPAEIAGRSRNEHSLVVRVERGDVSILLTGDIGWVSESSLVDAGVDLRADVLKVAHHGSGKSSSLRFLEAVNPSVAIVSAPCHSRMGLPNPEALARLRSRGAAVWWTGRDGAVSVPLATPLRVWNWDPSRIRSGCERGG